MPKKVSKEENKAKQEKKHYFKDFKAELKKVIWPTPKQLINNTITVIAMVLITAVIVFALDLIFESANKYGLEKIKDVVSSNATNTVNNAVVENATVDNTEPQPEVTTDNPDTTADQGSNDQAEAPVEE
mgnify:CR=1 FL=1